MFVGWPLAVPARVKERLRSDIHNEFISLEAVTECCVCTMVTACLRTHMFDPQEFQLPLLPHLPTHPHRKAKRALEKAKRDKDTHRELYLSRNFEAFDACWRCSRDQCRKQSLAQLQADLQLLRQRGISAPVEVQACLTGKFCRSLIQKERYDQVAASMRPWTLADDMPFREESPQMAPVCGSLMDDTTAATLKSVGQEIRQVFFCNEVYDLFKEPTEGLAGLPAKLATCILQEYGKLDADSIAGDTAVTNPLLKLPTEIVDAMDEIFVCCKAVVALAEPAPGHLGSSYDDVMTIFAPCGTHRGSEDNMITESQALFSQAVLKSMEWKARLMSYWDEGKDDRTVAGAFQSLLKRWPADNFETCDPALVSATAAQVAAWLQKLRAGSCARCSQSCPLDGVWAFQGRNFDTRLKLNVLCSHRGLAISSEVVCGFSFLL